MTTQPRRLTHLEFMLMFPGYIATPYKQLPAEVKPWAPQPYFHELPCGLCGGENVQQHHGGHGDPSSYYCPDCHGSCSDMDLTWQKPRLDGDLWDAIQVVLTNADIYKPQYDALVAMTNRYQRGRTWAEEKAKPWG